MNLLKKFTKSSKAPFISYFLIVLIIGLPTVAQDAGFSALWFFLGAATALVVCFGPVVWIRVKKYKVPNPRKLFVEPNPFGWFVLVYVPVIVGAIIGSMAFVGALFPGIFDGTSSVATFFAAFAFFFGFLLPFAAYTGHVYLFYKRVIQFNTSEWRRLKSR